MFWGFHKILFTLILHDCSGFSSLPFETPPFALYHVATCTICLRFALVPVIVCILFISPSCHVSQRICTPISNYPCADAKLSTSHLTNRSNWPGQPKPSSPTHQHGNDRLILNLNPRVREIKPFHVASAIQGASRYLIVVHQKIHIHQSHTYGFHLKMKKIIRRLGNILNVNRPDIQNYMKVIESSILIVNYPGVHIGLGRGGRYKPLRSIIKHLNSRLKNSRMNQ